MDIKNTLEVIEFVLALGEGFAKSLEDKKLDATDIMNFFPAIMLVPNVIDGVNLIGEEMKELSPEETMQIRDLIISKLGHISGIEEKWLVLAQEAFSVGSSIIKLVGAFKKA